MDIQQLLDWTTSFYNQYPIFCYVAGGVVLLLILRRPRNALKNLLFLLVLALVLYICLALVQSIDFGISIKNKEIHRTEKEIVKDKL